MSERLLVMKFGGTNMADAVAIAHSASLVKRSLDEGDAVVVVVSAMEGVTNALISVAENAEKGDIAAANETLAEIRTRHVRAVAELGERPDGEVSRELRELFENLRQTAHGVFQLGELSARSRDLVVSFGERLSAPLMRLALRRLGHEATSLSGGAAGLLTDKHFGNARPLPAATDRIVEVLKPLLDGGTVPVVAGFMGETESGAITTLGRGGTDYSATIVAAALGANEVWAWKDVDGVMTADPRAVPEAQNIKALSYAEVTELAYFGAKVLHPLAVTPLQENGIPLRVKSAADPDFAGTLVGPSAPAEAGKPVKAVTAIRGVSIINAAGAGVLGVPAAVAQLFDAIARENITLLMISQSSSMSNVSLAVADSDAERALEALRASGAAQLSYERQTGKAVLAIVGGGMKGQAGVAGTLLGALGALEVNVNMISQGSSELNVSVVIDEARVAEATSAVHAAFGLGH